MPPPSTFGFGIAHRATTRPTPAAASASTHGGVRPWCVARLERHVDASRRARAAAPARLGSAITSACARPRARASPRRRRARPRTMTQPTRGLGVRRVRGPRGELERARHGRASAARVAVIGLRSRGSRDCDRQQRHLRRPTGSASAPALSTSSSSSRKSVDVLEAAVHRGEADVGDLVELVQLLHHHLADLPRRRSRARRARAALARCARSPRRPARSAPGACAARAGSRCAACARRRSGARPSVFTTCGRRARRSRTW